MTYPLKRRSQPAGSVAAWILVGIAVILAIGAAWYFATKPAENANGNTNAAVVNRSAGNANTTNRSIVNTNTNTAGANANRTVTNTNTVSVNTNASINTNQTVSASGFILTPTGVTPPSLTVERGTTVTWTNNTSGTVYVAPDDHPEHMKYRGVWDDDGMGQIGSGQSYSFTFSAAGTYGWHDHINPSVVGTVIVR